MSLILAGDPGRWNMNIKFHSPEPFRPRTMSDGILSEDPAKNQKQHEFGLSEFASVGKPEFFADLEFSEGANCQALNSQFFPQ